MPETDPGYIYDGLGRDEMPANDEKLPPVQRDSIEGLVAAFKFMLEDEIAFALTQANPITQQILSKVRLPSHTLSFNFSAAVGFLVDDDLYLVRLPSFASEFCALKILLELNVSANAKALFGQYMLARY